MVIIKQTSKALSHAQMEREGLGTVIGFAEGIGALSLEQILETRLTIECLSMYYVDGSREKP